MAAEIQDRSRKQKQTQNGVRFGIRQSGDIRRPDFHREHHVIVVAIPAAGGPYTHVSLWTASTGGTYCGSGALSPAETFAGAGALDVTVTVTGSGS